MAAGNARMCSAVPAASGAAHVSVSPSAAAGMARFALSETEVPRSVMTCLS